MFIEVTRIGQYGASKGMTKLINVNKIISVRRDEVAGGAIIETEDGVQIVKESFEEIKEMLIPTDRERLKYKVVGGLDDLFEEADNGICDNSQSDVERGLLL